MTKRLLNLTVLAVFSMIFVLGQKANAQAPANCPDVLLQAFDYYPQPINIGGTTMTWNDSKWTTLNSQVDALAASFDMIWLPPSGNAMGGTTSNQTMGYLPVYWFNQNSSFGSQSELITLITNLKAKGCDAIADIVINHRNGVSDWCTFPTETYNGVTYSPNSSWICSDDESRADAPAGCNNPQGAVDTGEKYGAARDLDHSNSQVRAAVKGYMDFLKNEIGYAGWRYDVAAGYSASYVGEYDDAASGTYSVGEIMNCDYNAVEAWINGTGKKSTAFDFPFQCTVRSAFSSGDYTKLVWKFLNTTNQPCGLIHNPDLRRYSTTFIENHDTYRYNLGFSGNIEAANAFMIGSPGVPCVYLPHWNKYKTNIAKMIAARKKAGLHSQSAVVVLQTASNIYVGEATGTLGKLIVKVGPGSYSAPADYTLECSGTDWAIWVKTTSSAPVLACDKASGTYIGGTTVTLSTTLGTAPVKIYYTLDGSVPTQSSTLYSAPISITVNNTNLRAIAWDNLSIASNEINNTYITANIPQVIVTPGGGTYIGGTSVTLSSSGGVAPVKIYYTLDGSTPDESKTLYTTPISITVNNTVLKAVAIDAQGTKSDIPSHTYITEAPAGITVKFKAPSGWTTAACYVWGGGVTVTAWPGVVVSKDANGYYTHTITGATSYPVNVIFNNNNGGQQTVDLQASADICWDYSGSSTPYNVTVSSTCGASVPTVAISPAGGYFATGTDVTLSSTGGVAPVKIYYTTNGSTPTASSTLYTGPFHVTDNVVKAIAIDNGGASSAVLSETYTTVLPSNIKVGFKVPAGWTTVKVWAWKGVTNFTGGVWPGQALTVQPDGFVYYERPIADAGFSIIFNNGGNNEQTNDITNITSSVCYETTTSTGTTPKKYSVQTVACVTSLGSGNVVKSNISLYPNPAREQITVESETNLVSVQIYNLSGVLVKSVDSESTSTTIEISELTSGFYSVVTVDENGNRSTTKLIKK